MPGPGLFACQAPAGAERFSALNGTIQENIERKLRPAANHAAGYPGVYSRAGSNRPMRVIPADPDWVSTDDNGSVIEEWKGTVFKVFASDWNTTGFGVPQLSDRLAVTMGDGIPKVYAVLPPNGMQPFDMTADRTVYVLKCKEVKG